MEGQSIVNVDEIHRAARFSIRPDSGICTVPEDQMLSVLCTAQVLAHWRTLSGLS